VKLSYYLTGPDGSGKTTYLQEIESSLKKRGEKTNHIWIRSPKILSKPLMLYCRIVGLTKYKYIDSIKYGGHQFYRSRFVSFIFPILQLIDFKIRLLTYKNQIRVNDIVLFDRFALDTLADLMVDTHRFDLHKKWIGKQFLKMLDEKIKIILLKVDEEIIKKRKLDTKYDDNTAIKNRVYSILARDLGLLEICNDREIGIVKKEIFKELKLHERI
jgi:thymidylate kinase